MPYIVRGVAVATLEDLQAFERELDALDLRGLTAPVPDIVPEVEPPPVAPPAPVYPPLPDSAGGPGPAPNPPGTPGPSTPGPTPGTPPGPTPPAPEPVPPTPTPPPLGSVRQSLSLTWNVSVPGDPDPVWVDPPALPNVPRNYIEASGGLAQGDAGDNDIWGHDGIAETLRGGPGSDLYHIAADVTDTLIEATAEGVDQVDTYATDYTLPANVEILSVSGSYSHTLRGNNTNSATRFYGGDAPDTFHPGMGRNWIQGGGGGNLFVFKAADGASFNRIVDFKPGTGGDRVRLDSLGVTDFATHIQPFLFDYNGYSTLRLGTGKPTIQFLGVSRAQLTAENFSLAGATPPAPVPPGPTPPTPGPVSPVPPSGSGLDRPGFNLIANYDFGENVNSEADLKTFFHGRYIYGTPPEENGIDTLSSNGEWQRFRGLAPGEGASVNHEIKQVTIGGETLNVLSLKAILAPAVNTNAKLVGLEQGVTGTATLSTGSKTFTAAAGMAFEPGDFCYLTSPDGGSRGIQATITAYNSSNGSLTVNATGVWGDQPGATKSGTWGLHVYKITSGMLRTKLAYKYGRFEARIKGPLCTGGWPAFWLNPQDQIWPPEIDIVELVANVPERDWYNASHHGVIAGAQGATLQSGHKLNQWNQYFPGGGFDWSAQFHRYAAEWEPGIVRMYVDDIHVGTWNYGWKHDNGADAGPAHVLLNLAIGGGWAGPPQMVNQFPAEMLIDYMRIWALAPQAPTLQPTVTALQGQNYQVARHFKFGTAATGDGVNTIAIPNYATMRTYFQTRFPWSNFTQDAKAGEWQRYRDNNNHVFTANSLQLTERLTGSTVVSGGIESGMIASLYLQRGGLIEVRCKQPTSAKKGYWGQAYIVDGDEPLTWPPQVNLFDAVYDAAYPNANSSGTFFAGVEGGGETVHSTRLDTVNLYATGHDMSAGFHTWSFAWDPATNRMQTYYDQTLIVDRTYAWPAAGNAMLLLAAGFGAFAARNGVAAPGEFPFNLEIESIKYFTRPGTPAPPAPPPVTPSPPPGGGPPWAEPIQRESGPITITTAGAVIEGYTKITGGIRIVGNLGGIIIRRSRIEMVLGGQHGIEFAGACTGALIEDVHTYIKTVSGRRLPKEQRAIKTSAGCHNLIVRRAMWRNSGGAYLFQSNGALFENVIGFDMRCHAINTGGDPRGYSGQFVQFNECLTPTLQDFYNRNDLAISSTVDNVSLHGADGGIVRRGLIDGNTDPVGVGVMVEHQTTGATVQDVDTLRMGNGAFSAYDGSSALFERVRARDFYNEPAKEPRINLSGSTASWTTDFNFGSNGIHFVGAPGTQTRFRNSKYFGTPGGGIAWSVGDGIIETGYSSENFVARTPIDLPGFPFTVL